MVSGKKFLNDPRACHPDTNPVRGSIDLVGSFFGLKKYWPLALDWPYATLEQVWSNQQNRDRLHDASEAAWAGSGCKEDTPN